MSTSNIGRLRSLSDLFTSNAEPTDVYTNITDVGNVEQDRALSAPFLDHTIEEDISDETSLSSGVDGGDAERSLSLPSESIDRNDESSVTSDWMEFITEAVHHIPRAKKILGAFVILTASLFTGEELVEEFTRHHSSSIPSPSPTTRLEVVTICASSLSASVGVGDAPFNSVDSPQIKAIEWLVTGPGRQIPVKINTCQNDELFMTLYSLQVLKFSTDISVWEGETEKISNMKHLCNWNRLSCDENKNHVTRLHLNNIPELNGTIPNEIAKLSYLEHIEIYDNPGLIGEISPVLSNLSNLQYFYVHHTSISGNMPPSLAALVNLRELFVEDTNLVGSIPNEVCALRKGGALKILHADCKGEKPSLICAFPSCCTNCYQHHNFAMKS